MLYERWREVLRSAPDEIALQDLGRGERWTFRQLDALSERPHSRDPVLCPRSGSADFIFEVLRAWRHGQVSCPLEPGQAEPVFERSLPRQIAHLKTTSATTGTPRLVAFTAEQLAADARNIVATMGLCPEWPNLGVISLAHSYGFSNLVLPLLLHGVPLVIGVSPLPENLREAARAFPHLTLPGVPALWRAWSDAAAIPNNVRLAISAGAPLPVALEARIHAECGLKVHNFYGSSECGGIAYDATLEPRTDGACVGTPMRNVDVRIAEDGCVEVRGNAVGETYWPEPGPALRNGCFRTSDLGEISEGAVFLRGRAGDQINVAGRKVAPEQVEHVIQEHPAVTQALVFGVPSTEFERGEIIVACVAFREGGSLEDLRMFLQSRLPAWQVPRDWWVLDTLPTNQRGKLPRAEWRERYLRLKEPGNSRSSPGPG